MADQLASDDFSPLDQIRLVEAEITRKIVAAREASERAVANAHSQAGVLKKQARESGNREGQVQYKAIISKAEEEAQTMVAHAHKQAKDLLQFGSARMDVAIQYAVGIVVGLEEGGRSNES